jgi:hypothetical protein
LSLLAVFVAGVAYFVLGGLWFTPLFGKQWDQAVGFDRPVKWRPDPVYYIGPLLGCLVASFAVAFLMTLAKPESLLSALLIGLAVGLGFGATITSINAISPNMPKPGLYAAVTGGYHLAGLILCSAIIYWISYA